MLPHGIVETPHAFYIVVPFVRYTVADLLMFSPCRLSHTRRLFILYQILSSIRHFHSRGVLVGDLRLSDIMIDDRLAVRLPPPDITSLCCFHDNAAPSPSLQHQHHHSNAVVTTPSPWQSRCCPLDLSVITARWVYGELSNYDYLMLLNRLAGRSTDDPNHYPILPWTIDFTVNPFQQNGPVKSSSAGFRDLTRSKYRLNKGDEQLNLTYDSSNPESMMRDPGQTPFHVSDFLSDITYYVYTARRTSKTVLCRLVRQRWVPEHYPVSMERLYHWTPDECIPEFYTDPSVFKSLHEDLPDLELPAWCDGDPEQFIRIHQMALESVQVSRCLHEWIDLTFGYKVSTSVFVKPVSLQVFSFLPFDDA